MNSSWYLSCTESLPLRKSVVAGFFVSTPTMSNGWYQEPFSPAGSRPIASICVAM